MAQYDPGSVEVSRGGLEPDVVQGTASESGGRKQNVQLVGIDAVQTQLLGVAACSAQEEATAGPENARDFGGIRRTRRRLEQVKASPVEDQIDGVGSHR